MSDEIRVKRKSRSDKKHTIAPFVPDVFRVWSQRIANHLHISEGEVGAKIVETCINEEECIRFFAAYYKRTYSHHNLLFMAQDNAADISQYIEINVERDRLKLRVSKTVYNRLCDFQIALGTSYLAHATHALLRYGLHSKYIINKIAPSLDYSSIFLNAPVPRTHSRITTMDIAFKVTETTKVAKSNHTQNGMAKKETSREELKANEDDSQAGKRSVWSVLR